MDGTDEAPNLLTILVDAVLPLLKPYEFSLYMLLLRHTNFDGGEVRIGKRTISARLGKGTRSGGGNYQHITAKINELAAAGFIAVGDSTREGTRYRVLRPESIPAVREILAAQAAPTKELDYFTDPALRAELMERDHWTCHYCGEAVTEMTATLDHIIPQSGGGLSIPGNLTTACLSCNSIKSGRTYEEAAPHILAALVRRKAAAQA
ncbi:HNH endonuclease [Mycobacterium intracellulare]|uniref:HNH endonuclease signature motif containing protein n=1 Tax=Mycobacterium intracellulare subsp. chimaera TaxID=222805 RepID=A0A7U5MMG9_MYCIT|nr:HNH endonuclease signature motif containing protein [Mycobacterium intracellulare]ASL16253.1 HNH endonuclease, putative [Mycobacterium intracellulare subsp. chimaera]MCF1814177.1 HNH endonuclease [Mycobacterium intracellulare subsp. intracellulare]MDM3928983.1 HNH endonuclease signature motif containing protein [Mycobacterium intracellulare subsp. chimaera]MDS0335981.1 HNH endonuclease [Mycobacterium intracellulare]